MGANCPAKDSAALDELYELQLPEMQPAPSGRSLPRGVTRWDLDALLAVLDPDVVRRADLTAVPAGVATEVRGARAVAEETVTNTQRDQYAQLALVNGAPGIVLGARGRLELALCLTVRGQKIAEIDVIANPARLRQPNLAILDG